MVHYKINITPRRACASKGLCDVIAISVVSVYIFAISVVSVYIYILASSPGSQKKWEEEETTPALN